MDKALLYKENMDKELAKVPFFVNLEKKYGVPKIHIAGGLAGIMLIFIIFNIAGSLITNLVGFVYPAYASFKALETKSTKDDVQWLTYWIVFAFFNVIEFFADIVLYWIPFYFVAKTLLLVWLFLPFTKGAEKIYLSSLRPFLLAKSGQVDSSLDKIKKAADEVVSEMKKD